MKFVIVAAVLVAVVSAAEFDQEFKEKVLKKVQEAGTECAEKEGANADDIGELMAKKAPSRKEGKCLLACFNEKFGVQDAAGKLSMEGALKSIEPFKAANEEIYGKMKKVLEKCIPEVGDAGERCETAVKMAACSKVEAEALDLSEKLIM